MAKFNSHLTHILKNFFCLVMQELSMHSPDKDATQYVNVDDSLVDLQAELELLFRVDRVEIKTYRVKKRVRIPHRFRYYLSDEGHKYPKYASKGAYLTIRVDKKDPSVIDLEMNPTLLGPESYNYVIKPEEFKNMVNKLERIGNVG